MLYTRILYVALGAGLILLLPLLAMQITDVVIWGVGDFAVAFALLFGAGLTYVLLTKNIRNTTRKIEIAALVILIVLIVWSELAVDAVSQTIHLLIT